MRVEQRVRQFIQENFCVEPSQLADETSLIGEGFVDSTGMLEVIVFLETEYGIKISDVETVPDNLETIRRIADFVARKRAPVAAVS
ncbi:MAG TPA: acyl carrier protein [Anaeromyxobacter sp.]